MTWTIRRAVSGDEETLAHIQTESWKAAFCSIIPPGLLAKCTDVERTSAMYRRLLQENRGNGYILFVGEKPHCIAWWDAARDENMAGFAEIICIHSLKDNWRQGYGSRMMDRLLSDISASGYKKVMLWVFTENERARRFYEANGFHATDRVQPAFSALEMCYERSL